MNIALVGAGMFVALFIQNIVKQSPDWIDFSAIGLLIVISTIRSALLYVKDGDDYLHK